MEYFRHTNIDFISKRTLFAVLSIVIAVIGIIMISIAGIEFGIDFKGGTEIAIEVSKPLHTDQIRKALSKTPLTGTEIKSYGKENQYLIRVKDAEDAPNIISKALQTNLTDVNVIILKVDKIGPKVGGEMRWQAFLAVIIASIAIMIYIAFRFEFVFGIGAFVALFHDVVVTFTIVVFCHHLGILNLEVDQSILAAMLTVIGYSVNDTVIIFDRIRENRVKHKGMNFVKLINMSINETLSRTINTVTTVLLVLLTMVFFGGPVLKGFAFTMTIGLLVGTYSSVYIASSFVIWYMEKVLKMNFEETAAEKKAMKAAKA